MKSCFVIEVKTNSIYPDKTITNATVFAMCFSLSKVATAFEEIQDKVEVMVTTAKKLCESNKLYTHDDFCSYLVGVAPGVGCEIKKVVSDEEIMNIVNSDTTTLCGSVGVEEDIICTL